MSDDVLEIDTADPADWPADPAEWPADLVVKDIDNETEVLFTRTETREGDDDA